MDGTKNATRLGGLTLAVGLGIAVSSGQGVAHADTGSADGGSPGSAVSSRASATDSATPSKAAQRQQRAKPRSENRDALSSRRASDDNTADDKRSVRNGSAAAPVVGEPLAGDDATLDPATPDAEVVDPPQDDPAPAPTEDVIPVVTPADPPASPPTPDTTAGSDQDGPPAGPKRPSTEAGTARDDTSSVENAEATMSVATAGLSTSSAKRLVRKDISVGRSVVAERPARPESAAVSQPALSPLAALVAVPARIVTGLLAWVGLGSSVTAPGSPATPVMKLLELAWVAMRRIKSFFVNSTPTATVTLYEPTSPGVITGRVVGVDADGDRLAYKVIGQPENGTVTLAADGTFTYTPTVQADGTLAADSFRVAVVDTGFHLHGLLGFLKPARGHATVATINLDVAALNGAPLIEAVSTVTTPETGVVSGTVRITDRENESLDVSVAQPDPELGNVVLAHIGDNTWQWTFTPTAQARLDARDAEDPVTAEFTLIAGDGRAVTSLPITATISPDFESPIVLSHEVVFVPINQPTLTISLPESNYVVIGEQSIILMNPGSVISQTINLPAPVVSTHTNAITGEIIVTDLNLSVSVVTSTPGGLVLNGTGITLPGQPTDMTTVGGNLVVASGSQLGLYGDLGPIVVSGLPHDEFNKVEVIGTNNEVVVTHKYAVSRIAVITDLGPARMLGAYSAAPAVEVEVTGTVDFGEGVIGELAVHGNSIFVTVTEDGCTRLVKIDDGYYDDGLEVSSSVELPGSASSLAISEDGRVAYVVDDLAGTVTIIAIQDYYYGMDVLQSVNTGPGRVSALSDGGLIITDPAAGTVSIIRHVQGALD